MKLCCRGGDSSTRGMLIALRRQDDGSDSAFPLLLLGQSWFISYQDSGSKDISHGEGESEIRRTAGNK